MGEKTKAELLEYIQKLLKKNKSLLNKLKNLTASKKVGHYEKYSSIIFDNIGSGMALLAPTGKVIQVNKAMSRILGYSEEELYKMTFADYTHPHDLKASQKLAKDLLTGKRDFYQLEKRYIRKDGHVIWVKLTATNAKDSKGKTKFYLSLVEDITSKKDIAKRLAAERELLDSLMQNTPDSIYFKDLESRFLKVNQATAKKLGFKNPLDLLSKSNFDVWEYEYAAQVYNDEQEIIKTGIPIIAREEKEVLPDGKITWVSSTKLPLYDETSKIIGTFGITRDITEQKKVEEALRQNEARFKELFNNMSSGCSIYEAVNDGENFIFKDFNHISEIFLKIEKEHVIGKSVLEVFPGVKEFGLFDVFKRVWKTGKPEQYPTTLYKDNRIHGWYENYVYKLPSGEIVTIYDDITTQKTAEETLLQEREQYRILFENSVDGIFIMTDLFEDCNSAVCKLFACEREDIIGHSPVDFSPEYQPDGRLSSESAKEKINTALKGTPQRFYWKHLRKDGKLIDCEVALQSIKINNRNLIQATVRDISDKTRADKLQNAVYKISEAALEAEDISRLYQRIHEIIGQLMPAKNIFIALYDEKTELLTFPYMVDEFDPPFQPRKLGKGLTEYILRTGVAALIDADKDLELRESGGVDLIGTPAAIWLGVPLKLGGKTIGVIVVQDYENEKAYGEDEMHLLTFVSEQIAQVIERKRSSDAVKQYADELKLLITTKDKFFSIIAHDLRNPFITILGFSDLLHTDYAELSDEERLYYIDEMKKSAEISHSLLQNLLQWSRAQTGRIEFNPQKINLYNIVHDNTELIKSSAERKQIGINSNIPKDIFILADEDMLNTIIRNLLTNALKFTNKGGRIDVVASKQNGLIEIMVSDTGVGMSDSVKNNLFKLDATNSTPGTENEAGTGLGLLLCKEFVEKNGGTIKVESEPGKGSKFIFSLPNAS